MMSTHSEPIGQPIGSSGRLALALGGGLLLAGFALAAMLDPDPRGFGTHQRLGLPECSFQMLFQRPCPGCGMTTSFAHFVRGDWWAAGRANLAGLLLALNCVGLIPWCWLSAWCGRLWCVDDPWPVLAWLLGGWGAVAMIVWIVRWLV